MNSTVEIVVAVLAAMLGGMGLCALGVFCYFMLQGMKQLQQAAEKVVAAVAVVSKMEAMLGDGSPMARAAKSVSALSENLPMIMGGLKSFSTTMDVFLKVALDEKQVEKAVRTPIPGVRTRVEEFVDESGFIPYSEEKAAQYEVERAANAQRLELSKDEMAGMRTDKEQAEEPQAEEAI